MSKLVRLTLAFAAAAGCVSAFAADGQIAVATAGRAARLHDVTTARTALRAPETADAKSAKSAGPSQPFANPYRAYPPSCLSDPLPDTPSGPTYVSTNLKFYATDSSGAGYLENGVATIWRIPCSSSEFATSVTLMRLTRTSNGNTTIYTTFPSIHVQQTNSHNTIVFGDPRDQVRSAVEPNTVRSDVAVDSPMVFDTTYVLENYPSSTAGYFDFNLPFTIRFDNLVTSEPFYDIAVPAYSPTQASYPAAFLDMPINGYLTASYYDPAHAGEGIVLQIYEPTPPSTAREFSFWWFTYDDAGVPFWLYGEGPVANGARSVTVPMAYFTGGGFAGNFGSNATVNNWGTATFAFPDCNTIDFAYTGSAAAVNGPTGNGQRSWVRIASINGLACE